ncbi:hypothetical protein PCASD_09061 [Puccinia coronata f. sp. avenae]|uniref:CxC1-like cysteine cluster associated with KDZ transposases domain-containing protein n=1 Tax=Puccinia coronata f. sp. avenae TaxID=200324 RepID=A0A2N5UIN9_9BASI|nr:hypothetical protein PCASD_09061 [Puccinia coronata f. sp. avenae]
MSGIFREQRTNYRRCIAPIEDCLRALERLEQLSSGAEGLWRINPGIITAHPHLEQDVAMLQEDSDHLVNSENSLQAEDFSTNSDFCQTDFHRSDTQEGLSLLDHAHNYHTFINQQNRERKLKQNWDEVMPSLLGAYLLLKSETHNWTTADWKKDMTNLFCQCKQTDCHSRTVDLVDLNTQTRKKILFCNCTPDIVRLLGHGYLGCSPVRPQTAFSINLLAFHNHLWQWCTIGNLSYMNAMQAWLEERSNPLLTKEGKESFFS